MGLVFEMRGKGILGGMGILRGIELVIWNKLFYG